MGFVSEELNETEKQLIKDGKASNMAVVYGKEASIWKVRPADPQPPAPTWRPPWAGAQHGHRVLAVQLGTGQLPGVQAGASP